MTRDFTETPPAGEPTPEPAPDNAREADAFESESMDPLEVLPVPELEEAILHPIPAYVAPPPEDTVPDTDFLPEPEMSPESAEIDPDKLDPDALKVIHRLHSHGHQVYLVGGCVRDLLLGRTPKDFDIATSAHPGEVRAIFRNCRLIGRRFRLAHIYFKGGKIIEVSTFRANPTELEANAPDTGEEEGGEGEEQNPDLLITHDNVFGTAEQDARRRDFTINGLFYDVSEGRVIDYVRGRRDLDERYIRTIGDPEVRMREDPVRILRAVRFASKLGLDIESRTYAAMEGAVEDLTRCAPARLLEETFRLIRGGVAAPSLRLLAALDALKILLSPVAAHFREHGRRGERTFYAYAEALDRRVASGETLDDAILLAALLVPIAQAAPVVESLDPAGRPSVAQAIEDLLAEFVQTARLPRRIAERCRLLLIAQRTLSGERRRKTGAFRRHPLFADALTVFEISVEATGRHRDALEAWKRGDVPPQRAGGESPAAAEPDAPRKRRRRRRRGGSSRTKPGSSEGTAAAPAGEASSSLEDTSDDGDDESDADEPDESPEGMSEAGSDGHEG
ncbi:polynucleotide adenylyltransferase PcnB [Archangium primigenium]|uniref:polynucleotide adenylyltransferase PcnB n=1 Tax=[Archangium] primigenium TaxID=2792470 RepID=UPI00195E078B|nr:polynucleotide adenylyltransferase PcnB [Archangium primigenium]MBM7114775.1 polynucleotide adenylyltransferase PcnB [Archangium primigenium]